jgi:glycine oxidase
MQNLNEFGTADVIVVGGGVAGLATARELGRRGLSVILVERGRVGAEASWAAAGMLAPQAEADRRDEFFELLCSSRDLYPAFADALKDETGISIELDRTGTLYLALTEEDEGEVARRYELQSDANLQVELLTSVEARYFEPFVSDQVRLALRFPADWQVENRRLVAALAASAESFGVRVISGCEVASINLVGGRACGVETSRGRIDSEAVVLAAGAWSSLIPFVESSVSPFPRIEPVRGQMLCFEARPPLVRHVVYSPRGYLVPRSDGRLLAGSTTERAGYDKSLTGDGVRQIAASAQEIAPTVGGLTLVDSWAGLRPRAEDDWPVIGASSEVGGLYFATGFYRNGILLAPLAGQVVAALCTGEEPAIDQKKLDLFSPDRFKGTMVG